MFRRLFELLALTAFSTAIALFAAFLVFDTFPELLGARSWYVPYFATRRDYVPDEGLVFRRRPTARAMDYKGDQWVDQFESLGVRQAPIRFEETLNEEGFRDESPRTKADVVVLGDSYIEIGEHADDTFARRLQSASGLRTANYGIAWYGPYQYLEVFKRYGLKREPKFALFCFFEGNDFTDTVQFRNWRGGGRYYHFDLRTTTRLWERFRLAAADTLGFARGFFTKAAHLPDSFFAAQLVDIDLGRETFKARWRYFPDTRPVAEILASEEGRGVREALEGFRASAEAAGIEPVVVFIPTPARIYAPYSTSKSGGDWLAIRERSLASLTHAEEAARRIATEVGVRFIDLATPFAGAAKRGENLYYPFDTHWNSRGRKLAAEYVGGRLVTPSRPSQRVAE